jgi:hypothetical protein
MRFISILVPIMGLVVCLESSGEDGSGEEGSTLLKVLEASNQHSSISGKFHLDRATLNDGKPLPKAIGYLAQEKGPTYRVIVEGEPLQKVLAGSDGEVMTLCGKAASVEGEGAFLLVESHVTRPPRPVTRAKRGGL